MYKQYIILRKDANASPQKLAVMTAHASMAFITKILKNHMELCGVYNPRTDEYEKDAYWCEFWLDKEMVEQWMNDLFTKVLLEAKNLNHLEKAVKKAEEMGLKENEDFFCIKDACLTELTPDEGKDSCFIAIGFRPMEEEEIKPLTKKYQLYK